MNEEIEKIVFSSIRAIDQFKQEAVFHVEISGDFFKGAKSFIKYENGYFIIKIVTESQPPPEEFDIEKGFFKDIKLNFRRDDLLYEADGIKNVTQTLSDPFLLEFKVKKFKLLGETQKKFHKLILQTDDEPNINPFQLYPINIDSTYYYGLFKVVLRGTHYECFRYKNNDLHKHYLIIDSTNKVGSESFYEDVETILLAIGIITGNLYRGENNILTYDNAEELWKTNSIEFNHVEKSIITDVSIITPRSFSEYINATNQKEIFDKIDLYITEETISKVCMGILKNEKIKRIIILILEGNSTKTFILRSSIYSVALETLSNIIKKENESKLNLITDTNLSEKIINKLHQAIDEYSVFLSEETFKILGKRINSFNLPTNSDKLVKAFEISGLNLTEHDIKTLKHRNDFLHGSSPVKDFDKNIDKSIDLILIANKLHLLLSCLLLKHLGYRGHIANLYVFTESKRKKTASEHFFRIIF